MHRVEFKLDHLQNSSVLYDYFFLQIIIDLKLMPQTIKIAAVYWLLIICRMLHTPEMSFCLVFATLQG